MSDSTRPEKDPSETSADSGEADVSPSSPEGGEGPRAEGRRRERKKSSGTKAESVSAQPALPPPSYPFLVVGTAISLALDLWSKAWAIGQLEGPGDKKIVVIENFFHFNLAKNKGGAWGLFGDQPDSVRLPFFFIISAVAFGFIVSLYRKLEPRQTALKWALPMLLGGALGNLVDRIRHREVTDFIDMFIVSDGVPKHWPTYNVADIWIVVGVGLMAVDMFTPTRKMPKRVKPAASDGGAAEA